MDDYPVVLHKQHGRDFPRRLLDAIHFPPNRKREPRTRVDIRHHAPRKLRSFEDIVQYCLHLDRATGHVGIDAVAVDDKLPEQRMKPRFHGRPQRGYSLRHHGRCLRQLRTGFFRVFKIRRFVAAIERADGGVVHHRVRRIRHDVAQAKSGCLHRHEPVVQLDGGVSAAALHIVPPRSHVA